MWKSIPLILLIIISFTSILFAQEISEIKSELKTSGFTKENSHKYILYLLNNEINSKNELNFLNQFSKNNFDKEFANAIILKKENKFNEAFEKLFSQLNGKQSDLLFYEELAWLTNATNQFERLNRKLVSINSVYKKYLTGLVKLNEGKYKQALDDLIAFSKIANKHFENNYWLSYTYRYLGDYQNAILKLKDAERIIDSTYFEYSAFLNAKGSLYYLSNNLDKAKTFYVYANIHSQKYGNNIENTKSLINLAILEDESGKVNEARKLFYKAENIAEKINSQNLQALINSELGVSFTFDSQFDKSKKHYLKSLEIYKQINDKLRISLVYNNLGNIYLTTFNYNSAMKYLQKGLETSFENKRSKILNLISLGDVYSNLSNFSQAIKFYEQAKKLSKEIKEITLEFEVEMSLGILEFNLGKYKNSLDIFYYAKNIISEDSNPNLIAEVLHKIGLSNYALANYKNAETNFLKSSKIFSESGDVQSNLNVRLDLANTYLNIKEIKECKNIITDIEPTIRSNNFEYMFANILLLKSEIAELENQHKISNEYLQKVLAISKKIIEPNIEIEANYQLAENYYKESKVDLAEAHYLNAIKIIEEISNNFISNNKIQISHFSKFDEIYHSLTEFYIQNAKYKSAFEIIDKSRSRNTFQNIKNHKLFSNNIYERDYDKLLFLDWQMKQSYFLEKRDSLKSELIIVKNDLIKKNPELKNVFNPKQYFSLEEKQMKLKNSETFISIYISEKYSQYFIIKKNDFIANKINIGREQLKNLITKISPYYTKHSSEEIIFNQDLFSFNLKNSNDLYKLFFKEIINKFAKNKNLIFSLPNELINYPLETLVLNFNSNESPYNYENAKFLIEDYQISYAPSFNIFSELEKLHAKNNNSHLLIGNPNVNNNDFYISFRSSLVNENYNLNRNIKLNPLKYSEEEISSINSILTNTNKFTSQDATEENFKKYASSSNIIHISTHSFLLNQQPFIVFSEDRKSSEDGFLEVGEIINTNLNSDLVVLSSCKSGLGVIDKQEGILGMQKSFFDAGAKSVIVSLWDVNDRNTFLLMELFYENLKTGINKSQALQKAKLDFTKKYSPNPYYWAAFVLSGNNSEINITSKNYSFSFYILVIIIMSASVWYFFKRRNSSTF
ncbi:MAG: CHAT domain-containing protein [Ignavibacteriae bacterium]|nr:CHAT domain-containing protein [Ignavibacteriota bacterium]